MAQSKEGGDKPERSKQPSKKAAAESRRAAKELSSDSVFVSSAASKKKSAKSEGYLAGHLLVAMPNMRDPRFERTVIYMCVHNAEGAMGLVINKAVGSLTPGDPSTGRKLKIPVLKEIIRAEKIVPKEQAVLHLAYPTVPIAWRAPSPIPRPSQERVNPRDSARQVWRFAPLWIGVGGGGAASTGRIRR